MKHITPQDYQDMMTILNEIHIALEKQDQQQFTDTTGIQLDILDECLAIIERFTTE